jgi:inosose dehydratase
MPARKHDRIRLGVASLVWGFDLSEQHALEVFLKDASDIGYEGVLVFDMTVQPWLDRPDEFKALLARYELDFTGAILRPTLDFAGTERLTKFMAAAGAEVMNISGRDGTQAEWDIVIPALQRHAEIAAANGIRAVYQHHTGWIAETMEEYERLLAATDRRYLGVMIDCGHATKDWPGHTAQEFIGKHPELDYIEFKDYAPESDLRTEVGRGLCDWPAVAEAVRAIDYRGWIVIEQNGSIRPPRIGPEESFRYVRDVLGLGRR